MKSSIVNGEGRGSVYNILLKALQSGDKYGYEINKEIETKSNGKYFLKEASLYSGLKRLQANGYITSYWKDGELGIRRHYYSITPLGIEKLNGSNFTWDNSKTFMAEIFNDSPISTNLKQANLNEEIKKIEEKPVEFVKELKVDEQETEKNKEIKKNPFQIEVSPLQRSIFDLNLTNNVSENFEKTEENKQEENVLIKEEIIEEKVIESLENNKTEEIVEKIFEENIKLEEKQQETESKEEKQEDNIETKQENKTKTLSQSSFNELFNNLSSSNYNNNLNSNNQKIDISKYTKQDETNESSIIFENKKPENEEIIKENNLNIKNEDEIIINTNNIEKVANFNEQQKEETKEEFIKKEENVNIKNIFGNLLVSNEDKTEENVAETTEEETKEEIEQPVIKELPRINVDDNINIMFNTNNVKPPKTNSPAFNQEKIIPSGTQNTPSVKQYINNVHKKTLISRATNINEEVNLEGISIREYSRMNNKLIKNSNYVYINKLNLILMLIISSLLIFESIISFVVLGNKNCLTTFEIILLIGAIVTALILGYIIINKYFKDKFKVEIKNYNFKLNLFYSILIFVVTVIIFVCINIFQGMNTSNMAYFVTKIILESILTLNIVLYPILKLWFYKLKAFSN